MESDLRKLKNLERDFSQGTIIAEEGSEGDEMFILVDGKVGIRKEDRIINAVDEPGSFLGEISSLLNIPRTATMIAASRCKMICIPAKSVDIFFKKSPQSAYRLSRSLAARLVASERREEKTATEKPPAPSNPLSRLKALSQG